jgi:hypothetical protein
MTDDDDELGAIGMDGRGNLSISCRTKENYRANLSRQPATAPSTGDKVILHGLACYTDEENNNFKI